ncbi:MAG: radical SAM protein, partial [Candidatus Omnitrophica bacterium]|nr:radical SAM protein [Candidatus Omnitrophota bacterium]
MRIALIYPPYKHKIFSENLEVVDDEFCSAPPIILAYVAAILERSGHTVMIVDAQVLKIDMNETLSRLRSFNPDLLGFRSESYHFPDALEWMRFLKLQLGKPVFTGGPNLSLYPRETLAHDQIDFGIIGEAIDSLPRLIRALENKQDLAAVPGIAYKRPDRTVLVNAAASVPVDFDAYPFPARHLLPNDKYYSFISQRKNFTIMLTGTGCPYRCKFCAIPHEYRRRSVRNVLAEIEECYKRYSVREIDFFDAALFVDRERTLELLRQLKRLGLDLEWSCRSRVDIVDKEILKAAADAGCRQIYYGIESVDQKILDSMGKRISVGDVKNAIKLTKGCGIRTMGFFMVGNEGDTPDSVRKTIDFAKSLDLDFVQVCQVIAKPGTPLHRQISEATRVDLWKEHIRGNFLSRRLPTLWTGLTEAEIRALTQEFYF